MIKLTFDNRILKANFDDLGKRQLPFAMALTLTRTAQTAQVEERIEMKHSFDSPTPFTINSVFIRAATKRKLEAFVFLRDEASSGTPPVKYLVPGVYGGRRRVKRYERALQSAGILGAHQLTVPGQGAKLNQYGNISGAQITSILSFLRGSSDPLQNRTRDPGRRKRKPKEYFAGNVKKAGAAFGDEGKAGIFQRHGTGVKPVLMFVDASSVSYEKQFDFFGIIRNIVQRGDIAKNFKEAMRVARRTARRK